MSRYKSVEAFVEHLRKIQQGGEGFLDDPKDYRYLAASINRDSQTLCLRIYQRSQQVFDRFGCGGYEGVNLLETREYPL